MECHILLIPMDSTYRCFHGKYLSGLVGEERLPQKIDNLPSLPDLANNVLVAYQMVSGSAPVGLVGSPNKSGEE